VVFPDPDEVDADLLGEHALFDDVADRLGMCLQAAVIIAGAVAKGVDAEREWELRGFACGRGCGV
jgi:hypothetical protein